ncbi:hypothetical protein [Sebaldella sp. S0638]|uniref:hypothetical protein n=1 Tax=Sebaldella sp. S0638 TaxID=2957809 RepID=UPI00209D8D6A|nr:hypothetical protein [Sebaldella sp. S0638]MCP1226533.1 hypothetical protein [Sebaldella sp. S0638]
MAKYKEIKFTGEHEKIGRLLTDKKITKEELMLLLNNVEIKDVEISVKKNDWKICETGNKILDFLFLSEYRYTGNEKEEIVLGVLEALKRANNCNVRNPM